MVSNGWKLDDIYQNLEKIDQAGHFNTFNPSSIFYGITYDFNKKGMITDTTTQDRAADYLVYLLHGELEVDELQNYIDQIVSKRSLFDENKWINFEGNKESNNNVSYNKLPERA